MRVISSQTKSAVAVGVIRLIYICDKQIERNVTNLIRTDRRLHVAYHLSVKELWVLRVAQYLRKYHKSLRTKSVRERKSLIICQTQTEVEKFFSSELTWPLIKICWIFTAEQSSVLRMFFIQFEDSVEASYQPRRLGEAIIWKKKRGKKKHENRITERSWNVERLFERRCWSSTTLRALRGKIRRVRLFNGSLNLNKLNSIRSSRLICSTSSLKSKLWANFLRNPFKKVLIII